MKRILFLWLLLGGVVLTAPAQSNRLIKELESKRSSLQEQIEGAESLLKSTRKDIGSQLDNLTLLGGQIEERRRYIATLDADITAIDRELRSLAYQLKVLNRELETCKDRYARSVRFLQRNRSFNDKLLFILSADNFSQMYRRMRYVREYASFQQLQGKVITDKKIAIEEKKKETLQVRVGKEKLRAERLKEAEKLKKQEAEHKDAVQQLQHKQKSLQQEIARRKKEADQLNRKIDQLIAEALEAERRKAEAARKKKNAAAKKKNVSENKKIEAYKMDSEDIRLSSNFTANKGKLPVPISGPYILVGRYGQYNVPGLRNVRLDNKGIDIQGKPGAEARAIFNGKVAAVFQLNGLFNVLVRHGSYISVYCNLNEARVKVGDTVTTRQHLGSVYVDQGRALLHFQLRREKEKLNPEPWLHR